MALQGYVKRFLEEGIDIPASAELVNGVDFECNGVSIPGHAGTGTLIVEFYRESATGTSDLVVADVEGSIDGATWFKIDELDLSVATDSNAVETITIEGTDYDVVRVGFLVNLYGISMLRLASIENQDSLTDLTNYNLIISI